MVQLRGVTESDLPVFYEYQLDPAANRMAAFTAKDPANREAFNSHWSRILADPRVLMKTILFESRIVGSVGKFEERPGEPEVTYWIGREFWGKGIATQALSMFLDLVKVRPIYARAARDNLPSLRVLEKCGFTVVRYEKGFANARGEEIEEAVLELRMGGKGNRTSDRSASAVASRLLIRAAAREDIPSIVAVSGSSIVEGEDAGFSTPQSEQIFIDAAKLSAEWQEPNFVHGEEIIVAELDGRVVGVVTIEDRGEALELINIDVPLELQSRGIGTRLVRSVEERARQEGKSAVTLGTSRSATGVPWKSLPWWQSRGYRVTHEEENAWTRAIGPGAREIRMRKDLP